VSQAPTAQQLFGESPWVTNPAPGAMGPHGPYTYNPEYFATGVTAERLCTIIELGAGLPAKSCKIVPVNAITPFGPYMQNQPNLMIQLPEGSTKGLRNAGLMAKFFQDFRSLEILNQAFTMELGMPFTFVMPPVPTPAT
jgi:hypothetical protein